MANGLIDPVFTIRPNKIDFIRRSDDPAGTRGSLTIESGRITMAGKAMTLRRSLPISRGHLTQSGKVLALRRIRPLNPGRLTLRGKTIAFANAQWISVPDFAVDRSSIPPTAFVPNIRVNWLLDPLASVPAGAIALNNIDLAGVSYDSGNDRIAVATNPGVDTSDVLALQATTSTGAVVISNAFTLYVRSLSTFPAAAVALTDAQGNATGGYGPTDDPEGVFFGLTGFAQADKWWAENVPAGATVTPLAGGSFTLAIAGGMAVGSYTFDVVRWTAANCAITRTQKSFTVT